jgi:RHS repeat-associated protein
VFTYDAVGRKLTMSDPDKGQWTYAYYSNGELKKQIDAKDQMIEFQYDKLGRTVNHVDCTASATSPCPTANQPSNTTWTYDTAPNGVGQLDNVQDSKTGYVKALAYDTVGRTVQTVISPAANENYYQRVNFDQYGRVYQQYDASATLNGVTNVYNASGYLTQINDAASNQPYYLVNAMDAMGHITTESNGAATTVRTYDATMGRLQTIVSTVINLNAQTGSITTQNFAYGYDAIGNMTSRKDVLNNNLTETFVYDEVNRLYSDQVGTAAAATINYDSFGNIAAKSGLSYTYGAGTASSGCTSGNGVHAALNVGGTAYTYDCNGNNLSGDSRTLQYSVFDKPTSISKGTFTATFKYDSERNLIKRLDNNNGAVTTTVYIGNVEKVIKPDNSYELRRYIAGAIVTLKYNSGGVLQSSTNQYVLKDHLGSTDVIIDQHGIVVQGSGNTTKQKQSFDPWGMRRDTTTWVPLSTSLLAQFDHSTTNKGFTGHEMVDELGIIHMGGRIYDPRIARFLQADPFIDAPTSTQNYNRYSYLGNNPVNGIDPSGYGLVDDIVDPGHLGEKGAEWVGDHVDLGVYRNWRCGNHLCLRSKPGL